MHITSVYMKHGFPFCLCSKTLLGSSAADLASHGCYLFQLLCHSPPFPWPPSRGPGMHTGKLDSYSFDCLLQSDGFHRQVASVDTHQMVA